jgi:hypothetical protein
MGSMPTATDGAMLETRAMGMGHQPSACPLLEGNISRESDTHTHAAEGDQIHRLCSIWIRTQLQPAILRDGHLPELHLVARPC